MNNCSQCKGRVGNRNCRSCGGAGKVSDDGTILNTSLINSMIADDGGRHSSDHSSYSSDSASSGGGDCGGGCDGG